MKEKFRQFMIGRYGTDDFTKFLLIATILMWGANLFLDSKIIHSWSVLFLLYAYFRMFSKNHSKRYQENIKYLTVKERVLRKFRQERSEMKQRKTHHIYRCPSCGQKIRIPRGKGRICITCPRCKHEFTKIS